MATQWHQQTDPISGALNTAARYSCRVVVPYAHRLASATMYLSKITKVGTLSVKLMQTDPGDAKGGAQVGTELANADFTNATDVNTKFSFVLASSDKGTAPGNRQYFLLMTGTSASDLLDEPHLIIEVDDLKTG